jgi:hypothetical protein
MNDSIRLHPGDRKSLLRYYRSAGTPGRRPARWLVGMIARWEITLTPSGFGFTRSRWSCEAVAVVLHEDHGVRVSQETVRRRFRDPASLAAMSSADGRAWKSIWRDVEALLVTITK